VIWEDWAQQWINMLLASCIIRIGSLYYLSSISMLSEWKKLEESTCRVILVVGLNLEIGVRNLPKPFWSIKRCFWGFRCSQLMHTPLTVFYTLRTFQRCRMCVNKSLYAKVMPIASWPIVLTTMVWEDATSTPITHAYGASDVCNFKKILEGSKPYHDWGLWKSKTYP
jgi:hypothetical protein